MQKVLINPLELEELFAPETRNFCVGQIVQVTADGQALVDFPGNLGGPIVARSVVEIPPRSFDDLHHGIPVLLVFENGDLTLPIILGVVRDTLYPSGSHEEVTLSAKKPGDVIVDGKKRVFEAKEEIVLRCGKSSITLRKDGKIVVKGTQLISRSSGTNKIKGSTVSVN
jgi:hypothetical protein